MGMDAELFAVGPHRAELAPYYDYLAGYYKDVPELTLLMVLAVSCPTTECSHALAAALGIGLRAFEQHRLLSPQVKAREAELWVFAGEHGRRDDVRRTLALAERGWVFYYRPNG